MTFGLRILKYICILRMLLFHLISQNRPFWAPHSDSAVHFFCLGVVGASSLPVPFRGGLHAISSSLSCITLQTGIWICIPGSDEKRRGMLFVFAFH